jgi:hypothetical protein
MDKNFETKFRLWWELVNKNIIDHCPSDFDYIEEIEAFLDNPDEQLQKEKTYNEELTREIEEKIGVDICK